MSFYKMSPAVLAGLAVVATEFTNGGFFRYKRRWPPSPSLLSAHAHLANTPRDKWGLAEWRDYALFLEESGGDMSQRLDRVESHLADARQKASRRRKPAAPQRGTLLTGWDAPPGKKRGRKVSKRLVIAREVLGIRAELEGMGHVKVTDRQALEEWFSRRGQRRIRVSEHRNILNAMSEIRRNHNNSGS
jgi:hypothetical protein